MSDLANGSHRPVAALRVLGSVAAAALCWAIMLPASRADGCFVWRRGADLNEPAQRAAIHFIDHRETLLLQVKYEGPAEDFAWVVPVPTRPSVDAIDADESPFPELSLFTQRRVYAGRKAVQLDGSRARRLGKGPEVEVLERKTAGVYDIAVLAAEDGAALGGWLNDHGYAFPPDRSDVLDSYARRGWTYVAVRIHAEALAMTQDELAKLRTGQLQPLRLVFATDRPIYPLEISSVNKGETEVLLYALGERPWLVTGAYATAFRPDGGTLPSVFQMQDETYGTYRPVGGNALPRTWAALGLPADAERYVCKHRAVLPTRAMTKDLHFAALEPVPFWRAYLEESRRGERRPPELAAWILLQHGKLSWTDLITAPEERVRMLVAHNCDRPMPWSVLRALADDRSALVRQTATVPRDAPGILLSRLATDPEPKVRQRVARHPGTPKLGLVRLSTDRNDLVRLTLAQRADLPEAVLETLAEDAVDRVREHVAASASMPRERLSDLASDPALGVRRAVACNPHTPQAVLRALSHEDHYLIRNCLRSNPSTPGDVLSRFANSRSSQLP